MTACIQKRDADTIAGIQKLRFFPHSITADQGARLMEEDGRGLLDLSVETLWCYWSDGQKAVNNMAQFNRSENIWLYRKRKCK